MELRASRPSPNAVAEILRLEALLWQLGFSRVAGVDEAGLGPLAGPVVAAAVVFPQGFDGLAVADSKQLSARRREQLEPAILASSQCWAIGRVEVEELDVMGVRAAGLEAMRRAVVGLDEVPDYLLVDARKVPGVGMPQSGWIKGDSFIHGVAAASILAKVYRDRLMTELGAQFPEYGFERHMGYGTAAHLAALNRYGPCAAHRRSFAPVQRCLGVGY
ncbi:MAG: ribonuclease HII [Hyphomicrobiaceae bacterium]